MPGPVFMHGGDVTFHPVEEDDLAFLQELINHPGVREGIASTRPINVDDEREWFDSVGEDGVQFLVAADGDRVGTISFRETNREWGTTEVAYFFHPDAWGNGYATGAVERMVAYAFVERRLAKVWARVFAFNDASTRVLEKVGFEHEATLREQAFARGDRVDMERYGLLAREWRESAGAGTRES